MMNPIFEIFYLIGSVFIIMLISDSAYVNKLWAAKLKINICTVFPELLIHFKQFTIKCVGQMGLYTYTFIDMCMCVCVGDLKTE